MDKDKFVKSLNVLIEKYLDSEDYSTPKVEKQWIRWHFVGWWAISLGLHISIKHKNMEIHLPFGFLKISLIGEQHTYYTISINI